MLSFNILVAGLAACSLAAPAPAPAPAQDSTNCTDGAFLKEMTINYLKNTIPMLGHNNKCTLETVGLRRSWSVLSKPERTAYLNAVKCMHKKPTTTDKKLIPGAVNRLDDYVWSHINQTNFVHVTGTFLPYHRQLTWHYENVLRTECGYKGWLPYWDFSEHADDQTKSAVFDGSETSFGGNGEYVPHNATVGTIPGLPVPVPLSRPAGNGGGCVKNGGFIDGPNHTYTVTLGPVAPAHNAPDNTYGFMSNPRCLKRDFYNPQSAVNLSWAVTERLMNMPDIHSFRPFMDFNYHPNAHQWAGDDLLDLFSSPNDPVFWLLHSNIDRLWTVWQGQDYASRGLAIDGTDTFANLPSSPNTTLDTVLIMHKAGGDIPVRKTMSAIGQGSQYCYLYF